MNSPRPSRISKSAVAVMLIIVGALALLAIFANMQRFRRDNLETVVVRVQSSPTPQPH